MDSKTKTSEQTILYGKWPVEVDDPRAAIQASLDLENLGADWFPKDSLILVKVADMIRLWSGPELELSRVFRRTPDNKVMVSENFEITIHRPGYAHIEVCDGRGIIEMEAGRVVNWNGFKDESVMLGCMKEFFDYHE
jgi:hypothetical protein